MSFSVEVAETVGRAFRRGALVGAVVGFLLGCGWYAANGGMLPKFMTDHINSASQAASSQ